MSHAYSTSEWLRSRAGRASLGLVVACALGLVVFVWKTFVKPAAPQYDLDFGSAQTIEPANPTPSGYYRKSLFLPVTPRQAWIQVAGSDSFDLFVNGQPIDHQTFVSTRVTGLYDLTSVLTTGRNVIAINVSRESYPGAAQLLVRGAYRDRLGAWQEFISDASWKVSSVPAGIVGGTAWNEAELDDASWASARLADKDAVHGPLQPVALDPRVLQVEPRGKWLGTPEAPTREAAFVRTIEIADGGTETWLQISATGGYELLINGGLAAKRSSAPRGFDVYRVTPWLGTGKNTVLVRVRPDRGVVGALVDAVMFTPFGAVKRLHSDESWQAVTGEHSTKALALGAYGDQPWGLLKKRFADVESYHLRDFVSATWWVVLMGCVFVAVLAAWFFGARWMAGTTGAHPGRTLAYDALLHAPVVAAMIALMFLGCDARFHADWPYQPLFVLVLIAWVAGMRVFTWMHAHAETTAPVADEEPVENRRTMNSLMSVTLLVITVVGFVVRVHQVGFMSLDHDEVSMVKMAKGVLVTGYPHATIGNITKRLTTYELVPYPIAASALAFGWKDWAVRLPALMFGTLTIYLIGHVGTRVVGRRAGVLAALIAAFLPWQVQWSRNAFYPSQTQFFALLTFWCFFEALQSRSWDRKWLTRATAFFCVTYLSWEGTGFILPALVMMAIVMQPGDWSWIRNAHLWRCVGVAALIVLVQQLHRMASGTPYLLVGSGLSELGLPTPYFLNTMYDPLFYVRGFLGLEHNVVLSICAFLGLVFFWRQMGIRYAAGLTAVLILLYTNLLGAYASRYAYFFMPLLTLAAAGTIVRLCDTLSAAVNEAGTRHWASAAGLAKFAWVMLALLSATGIGLDLYRLSSNPETPTERTRLGVYNIDYRGACGFVKDHLGNGDAVIPAVPHTYEYYTGLSSDFFLNTLLAQRVVYDAGRDVPRFTDRFSGNPVLRDLKEFQDAAQRHPRVWIIAAPYPIFIGSNDKQVIDYLTRHSRVAYETYGAQVFLLGDSARLN